MNNDDHASLDEKRIASLIEDLRLWQRLGEREYGRCGSDGDGIS